jgi:hypothetical protein
LEVVVNAGVVYVPEVSRLPVHEPVAVQLVAAVLLQVRVEVDPEFIDVGEALSDTVGTATTGGLHRVTELRVWVEPAEVEVEPGVPSTPNVKSAVPIVGGRSKDIVEVEAVVQASSVTGVAPLME